MCFFVNICIFLKMRVNLWRGNIRDVLNGIETFFMLSEVTKI